MIRNVSDRFRRLLRDHGGATAVEYGLIAALIVVVTIGAIVTTGSRNKMQWDNVETEVTNSMTP